MDSPTPPTSAVTPMMTCGDDDHVTTRVGAFSCVWATPKSDHTFLAVELTFPESTSLKVTSTNTGLWQDSRGSYFFEFAEKPANGEGLLTVAYGTAFPTTCTPEADEWSQRPSAKKTGTTNGTSSEYRRLLGRYLFLFAGFGATETSFIVSAVADRPFVTTGLQTGRTDLDVVPAPAGAGGEARVPVELGDASWLMVYGVGGTRLTNVTFGADDGETWRFEAFPTAPLWVPPERWNVGRMIGVPNVAARAGAWNVDVQWDEDAASAEPGAFFIGTVHEPFFLSKDGRLLYQA